MPRTTSSAHYSELIGTLLRQQRVQAGLTQAQLGERLEVSQSYINKMEAGRINMTIGQLARVCDALGATLRVQLDRPERDPVLDRMLSPGRGRGRA